MAERSSHGTISKHNANGQCGIVNVWHLQTKESSTRIARPSLRKQTLQTVFVFQFYVKDIVCYVSIERKRPRQDETEREKTNQNETERDRTRHIDTQHVNGNSNGIITFHWTEPEHASRFEIQDTHILPREWAQEDAIHTLNFILRNTMNNIHWI